MTFEQVIMRSMPNATPEWAGYVLWNRTPFPMGKVTAKDLYKAASRLQRAHLHNLQLCDLCDRVAVDGWNCAECAKAFLPVQP